ncbi:hypothetical protein AAHB62_17315 [Bacillus cereus]
MVEFIIRRSGAWFSVIERKRESSRDMYKRVKERKYVFYKEEIKGDKLIISDESIDILMDAFQNKGKEMPKNISWNFIATVLLAGSYYE